MKILAIMGVSIKGNSNKIITGDGNIEISNINWQCYINNHIRKNKAVICVEEVKKISVKMKCVGIENLVDPDSENIFLVDFWLYLDMVILTLYNDQKKIVRKRIAYNNKLI